MTKLHFQVGTFLLVMVTNSFLSPQSKYWIMLWDFPTGEEVPEQSLPYRDLVQSFRPSNVTLGPKNLATLPEDVRKKFLEFNMGDRFVKGRTLNGGITKGQVHQLARPYLKYNGYQKGWSNVWTHQLVETMIEAVKAGTDISCPDYPGSAWQVQTALDTLVPLLEKKKREQEQNDKDNNNNSPLKILIAGSISPWLEAIVLAHPEFSSSNLQDNWIITTDYNPLQIDHPSIHFVSMEELKTGGPPNFDLILSFSSIEHDGLGRYGDPINPRGDIAAMAEYHTMLRPQGGFLMLAVPTVLEDNMKGMIKGNNARIYSLERLQQALWCGFDIVGDRIDPPSMRPDNTTGVRPSLWDPVGYQPIFLLQKKTRPLSSSSSSGDSCYQQMLP